MNDLAALGALHHGFGSLGSTLAHAAVWSFVGRLMWGAPVLIFVAIAAIAAIYMLLNRRGER